MLNAMQKRAVTTNQASALILSGAGTGKSSVLVARIQHLLEQGTPAQAIMAISFTNKAANEIKQRLAAQQLPSLNDLWLGTFHSLCFKLLMMHCKEKCKVISQSQQLSIIKNLVSTLGIEIDAKKILSFINAKKDQGVRACASDELFEQLYFAYENQCEAHSLIDFGELILRTYELLNAHPALLAHYQQQFDYVLVDECQDTNAIQFAFLKLLTLPKQNLFIVGDDDQSIYGFRGAVVENMTQFQSDYPAHELVKLEQNYRCSKTILDAANHVIAHNKQRMSKVLRTDNPMGELITMFTANDAEKEARFIVGEIQRFHAQGHGLHDMAVLYRTHSQSDVLVDHLLQAQIPHFIARGQRFFDRKEIKLVLCYLQLALDCHDNGALEVCLNTPVRGIGLATRQRMEEIANRQKISYWQALETLIETREVSGKTLQGITDFIDVVKRLQEIVPVLSLSEALQAILDETRLISWFSRSDEGQERVDNLNELLQLAIDFKEDPSVELDVFEQFLAHACLSTQEENGTGVQLMTLHASKGLEFETVFLMGLEQDLFPSKNGLLEEERRLMYVGITRAKQRLFLTHAKQRQLYGSTRQQQPSRFLSEIPERLILSLKDKPAITLKLPQGLALPTPAYA
jgi:DNA helicase-2/ATP-dependent DNA helicase PcrA